MSKEIDPINPKTSKLESLISKTDYGYFTVKLSLFALLAFLGDSIEVMSSAYILPVATCDLQLDYKSKGWINASVFIGMTLGSIMMGLCSDLLGRRKPLIFLLLLVASFNLATSFSPNFKIFVFFKFFSGFGLGGTIPLIISYYPEFIPCGFRSRLMSFICCSWVLGGLTASILAKLIIPKQKTFFCYSSSPDSFCYKSWNLFLSVLSIPSFLACFLLILLPESPSFLYSIDEINKTKDVLKIVFKQNNPDKNIEDFEKDLKSLDEKNEEMKIKKSFNLLSVINQFGKLFHPNLLKTTILTCTIFNVQTFGFYGMTMWFPELFKRMEKNNGPLCFNPQNSTTKILSENLEMSCEVNMTVYTRALIMAFCSIPSNFILVCVAETWKRRPLISFLFTICGVFVGLLSLIGTSDEGFVVACIFISFSTCTWTSIELITMESFPTNLRSSGVGLSNGLCRIFAAFSNILFGYLLSLYCYAPIITISSFYLFGAVVIWFMDETVGKCKNIE